MDVSRNLRDALDVGKSEEASCVVFGVHAAQSVDDYVIRSCGIIISADDVVYLFTDDRRLGLSDKAARIQRQLIARARNDKAEFAVIVNRFVDFRCIITRLAVIRSVIVRRSC